MKKLFYFAYGSNMSFKRLEERLYYGCTKAGTHTLRDYALVFTDTYSKAVANIIPELGSFVEGVLYELTSASIVDLDKYEGFPFIYDKQYFVLPDGNVAFCYVYREWPNNKNKKEHKPLPETKYLNYLIEGALENDLYFTYNKLMNFKFQNYK